MQDREPSLEFRGDVAFLTLRRISQHNRIAPDDCTVIGGHLRQAAAREGLRALVLTGAGDKTFSSGYTLGAIRDQLDSRFEDMLDELERFPLPTICALNGSVYGGATDLALCCDFRIGVTGSRFLMPASRIGLHYYPGGIRRYVTVLGLAAAKKLFLAAQAIHDEEMLRIGFLQEVVDRQDLMAAVERYLEGIRACEPAVLRTMKADLMQVAAGRYDEAALRAHYEASLRSEALAARLETLAPRP
ncbi:enoyl-CoA hydratase/isomerase family protein [Castellaniella defragrans]|uniref:enoyl-CoA hydratase/isomerase family protein n=1 Tax=Castellaniella defragrans TaxID=75697 RepID=UPI002AFECF1A|nr:enoyl-CoA hydratase/isomerase family protein [Castellaniella defragrans]